MNSNSNELNKPDIPDSLNQDELKGMEFVANMRASADKYGAGFIGGFKDPKTGKSFSILILMKMILSIKEPIRS